MKKLNYVSPKAMYILLEEEDVIRTSSENPNDQLHNAGNMVGGNG